METSLETDSPSRRDPIGDSPIKEEGEDERKRAPSNFSGKETEASSFTEREKEREKKGKVKRPIQSTIV